MGVTINHCNEFVAKCLLTIGLSCCHGIEEEEARHERGERIERVCSCHFGFHLLIFTSAINLVGTLIKRIGLRFRLLHFLKICGVFYHNRISRLGILLHDDLAISSRSCAVFTPKRA